MKQKFKCFCSIVISFILLPRTKTAVTPTEELLKFYPLNSQEYEDLSKLIDQQSAVTENNLVSAGYRSLADWSQAMPNGWNSIFNMKRRSPRAKFGYGGYPLCVLKANRTKKTSRQFDIAEDFEYAGVAPNIVYTVPSNTEYFNEQPTYVASDPIQYNPPRQIISQNVSPNPKPGVFVNCVVVVRRYGKPQGSGTNITTTTTPSTSTTPTTTTTSKPSAYPSRPYPYPYPPPNSSPQCDPPPEGTQDIVATSTSAPEINITFASTANSELDSLTLVRLGQMLNEYYQQLVQLVRAQGATTVNTRLV